MKSIVERSDFSVRNNNRCSEYCSDNIQYRSNNRRYRCYDYQYLAKPKRYITTKKTTASRKVVGCFFSK